MSFKAILWGARLLKQRRIPEDGVVDFRINVQPGFANSGWQDLTALWSSCQLPAAPKRFFRVGRVGRVTFTSVPCFHLRRYERDAVLIRKLLQQHFHTRLPGNTQEKPAMEVEKGSRAAALIALTLWGCHICHCENMFAARNCWGFAARILPATCTPPWCPLSPWFAWAKMEKCWWPWNPHGALKKPPLKTRDDRRYQQQLRTINNGVYI